MVAFEQSFQAYKISPSYLTWFEFKWPLFCPVQYVTSLLLFRMYVCIPPPPHSSSPARSRYLDSWSDGKVCQAMVPSPSIRWTGDAQGADGASSSPATGQYLLPVMHDPDMDQTEPTESHRKGSIQDQLWKDCHLQRSKMWHGQSEREDVQRDVQPTPYLTREHLICHSAHWRWFGSSCTQEANSERGFRESL